MKIVVTGSLGNISKPLAEELIAKGHTVTVISSDPERQAAIKALGAAAAIGSLTDAAFLAASFTGADAVYAMIPPNFSAPDSRAYYRSIGNSYFQAAEQSGIKRIVHLSSWGAHLDHGTGFILGSHDVEGILNRLSGVNLTHLRPGSFYYNLLGFIPMIKKMGFIGNNYGDDDKIVMAAPADIAAAAAEELTATNPAHKVRYIASDELTANEAARILGAAIGRLELKWVTFTDEQTQSGLEQSGMPAAVAGQLVELGAAIHSGRMGEDYELHKPASMGKVSMQDYARDFAAAFEKD